MKPETRIAGLFITVAIILVASVAVAYMFGQRALNMTEEVEQHRIAISVLNDTFSTVKDAETGQRGYLLTRNEDYREPFDDALARIGRNLDELKNHCTPEQLAALKSDIAGKIDELEQTTALVRNGQNDLALAMVKDGGGKKYMDSIRRQVEDITRRREQQLHDAQSRVTSATTVRTSVFAMVVLINLIFLGWAYNKIRIEIIGRMAATLEGRRQKDLLAVTLASVGDAIILADTNTKIIYMNPVAEKLTGWTLTEAMGQPCASVFKIINEESRAIVDSPVDKVLRTGTIIGLANHTLLIRKDGSEIPIDDSGAPVREENGAVRGVVLVFRDFTDHKKSERELRNAKEDLERAAKAKDQFLATLSHELRTPLTPVLATLNIWEAGDELPEEFRADIVMLRRNIELEARLIDDLLDLTRIVQGKINLNPELCDIHDILTAAVQVYRSEIQGKRLEVILDLQATRRHVTADCARIQQVFWNLLKNATKFTPEGGRIEIRTKNDPDGRVVVSVTDSGIGMTPETVTRVFQPFVQGQPDTNRKYGGLGLGLAIAKAFTEVHGGTIEASSPGPTRGSTFTVRMLALEMLAASSQGTQLPKPIDTSENKLRIMLVEDHADSARVMSRLLTRMGHDVKVFDSVRSAMESISKGDVYDLILSDIGLPDGTGIDLIKEIRKQHAWPSVALTGFGMEEDITRCREAGFDAHITKPVSVQNLETVLRNFGGSRC